MLIYIYYNKITEHLLGLYFYFYSYFYNFFLFLKFIFFKYYSFWTCRATSPPSFALEAFVHCEGETKFRRVCQPFLYSHSSSNVLEVEVHLIKF